MNASIEVEEWEVYWEDYLQGKIHTHPDGKRALML